LYGVFYDEMTCILCHNGKSDYIRRHNNMCDAIDKGLLRQIPCYEKHKKNYCDYIILLASIYNLQYEKVDAVEEKYQVILSEKTKEFEDKLIRSENKIKERLKELEKREYELKMREDNLQLEEARIKTERNVLNDDKKPKWGPNKFDELEREITSVDINIDIKQLVENIANCIQVAAGNMASIPSLVNGLDMSLRLCMSNSRTRSYMTDLLKDDKTGNDVYVRIDYRKVEKEKDADVGLFSFSANKKKETLYISYLVLKPLNQAAVSRCTEIVNSDFEGIKKIIDHLK